MQHLPHVAFVRIVKHHRAEHKVHAFTCRGWPMRTAHALGWYLPT
jgi:hypothetical protein